MPKGKCKLCLEEKPLVESHLIPQAVYDLCRTPDSEPVLVTSTVVMQTSRQMQDYLLCKDCEGQLNRDGENWVLPKLATIAETFPFHDILQKVPPEFTKPDLVAYAVVKNPEIAVDKLAHFALGVFWKASVHSWQGREGDPRIELGPYGEKMRAFLRGESPFPGNMALLVWVMPPPVNMISIVPPFGGAGSGFRTFGFYVPGILFALCAGKRISQEVRRSCFCANPGRPVVVKDVSDFLARNVYGMSSKAHRSRKLVEYIRKRAHALGQRSQ
jgi:hypothetical protein